jgi:hypothetical protein
MNWNWFKTKKKETNEKDIVETPFEEISWDLVKNFSKITSEIFSNHYVNKQKTKVLIPINFAGCGYVGQTVIRLTNKFSLVEADNDLGWYDFVILINDTCSILINRSENLCITDLGLNQTFRDIKREISGYYEVNSIDEFPKAKTKMVPADDIQSIPIEIRKIIRICFDKSLMLYKEATGKISLDRKNNAEHISNLIKNAV